MGSAGKARKQAAGVKKEAETDLMTASPTAKVRRLPATVVETREKSVSADPQTGPTLVSDRRCELRLPIEGPEASRRISGTYSDDGTRFGVTSFELVDQSRSGLGVRTKTQIDPGMRVMICPPGSKIPWMRTKAVRCTPEADGVHFRVGLLVGNRRGA